MLNQPRLKRGFRVETLGAESTFLISERVSLELRNHWHRLLIPLIDGSLTSEEIVAAVLPQLLPKSASFQDAIQTGAQVFYVLNQMAEQGYITAGDEPLPASLVEFCDALNVDANLVAQRLKTTRVAVKSLGSASVSALVSILESLQIHVADVGDLEVVLADDYLQPELEIQNQKALQVSCPWMLVKPTGTIGWIGPIFWPGKTGCWSCLAHRLRGNRPIEQFIQRHKKEDLTRSPLSPPSLSSTTQTVLNLAATEIFRWVVTGRHELLENNLLTYDALQLSLDRHAFIQRPQCASCSSSSYRNGVNGTHLDLPSDLPDLQPIVLGRRQKTFVADGGHRCVTPDETLRKHQHQIDPITGVVRSIEKVSSGLGPLFHSYVARHHFMATFDNLEALRQNISGRSAGKGKTDAQARTSAFCEAIERYSGVFQGDEIRIKNSLQKLGDRAIHPNTCMNFSSSQYHNRHSLNQHCPSFFQRIPEPFQMDLDRDWTPVWSLTYQDWKYLPTAYCYHGYPQVTALPDCWADANGCAAGNYLEEAILQGFMELVERDCVALWWYNQIQRPAVDLDSFDDPYVQALKTHYQSLHRELWVLDITSDLNIPAFAAISRRTDSQVEDIVLGYGAHFDPAIALGRALTEANQILPAVLSANADGTTQYLSYEPLAIEWWRTATSKNQPYLAPDLTQPLKQHRDYPVVAQDDLLEDVKCCQHIAETHGLELLVLDQTRPDIGLKVVKVIVPGLRHFWRRLGPGRLYEVPIQMGWLTEPLTEEQLNPFPMWM